jgi:hypothetical protein
MGDWKALNIITPISDGKWHLFNITSDVGENNDLSMQHPEILQTMIEAYNKYAKDVGVVVPSESPIRSEKTANDGLAVD